MHDSVKNFPNHEQVESQNNVIQRYGTMHTNQLATILNLTSDTLAEEK